MYGNYVKKSSDLDQKWAGSKYKEFGFTTLRNKYCTFLNKTPNFNYC